jgi:CelD/BcsL family acetyltransferase involved in cellulose biosynthesis
VITTQALRDLAALADIRKDWSVLHRAARPGSAYEHPAWAETWARYFVPDHDLECIAVMDEGGSEPPKLIGFAPLYRKRWGAGLACIQPLGAGRRDPLTEVVQVLALPDRRQEVLRAVTGHLEKIPDWNWLQLSLGPCQGWLVPQWLGDRASLSIVHRATRPCVVMDPLPFDREALLRGLKRNVRESVRRSRNRTRNAGGTSLRRVEGSIEIQGALKDVMALHRRRSQMKGKVTHADVVADPRRQAFLVTAVEGLCEEGLARIHLAEHDGRAVAAQLVLSDGHSDYVSVSGMDTDYWHLGLNTLLIFEALSYAVDLGRGRFNFSTGPDIAKLRWSPQVETYNDFAIVRGDRRSRWFYGLHAHVSMAVAHHQERGRHGVVPNVRHSVGSDPA